MDFMDALRVLGRRWLILLLGILLTGAGCVLVLTQVSTVYQATAQYLLLLPSDAAGEENPQNPLVNQPAGLIIGAGLIAAEINTKDTVREMERQGFESDFSVALAPDSGPLLSIEVTDTDPAAALAQRDEILERLDSELERLQRREIRDIPRNQVIRSLTAAVNDEAEAVPGAKIRALVMVAGVGALTTLLLVFLLDGTLTRRAARRRERRERARESKATAESEEPVDPPRRDEAPGQEAAKPEPASREPAGRPGG